MSANSEFFGSRDAKAVLKHGLLARYAKYFAGRAGRATNGKVAFVDGYAGKGRYDDGNPGSPLLLATQAQSAKSFSRDVKLTFVEQDSTCRAELTSTLAAEGVEADQLIAGDFDSEIDGLLDRYEGHAILLFVDPFGLAINRDTLVRILRKRSRRQPIDVLYHFSLSTVARQGALGVGTSYGFEASAKQLDSALGPETWRAAFESSGGKTGEATAAALAVATSFAEGLREETSILASSAPVRRRPEHLPTYLLTLFSANRRAHWDFADMAGKTYVDWLHHCDRVDFVANVRSDQENGIMRLLEDPEPDVGQIDGVLADRARAHFAQHLPPTIRTRGPFRPIDCFEELYGSMLGQARRKHLQDAFKVLYKNGLIDDSCVGQGWMERPITWIGT